MLEEPLARKVLSTKRRLWFEVDGQNVLVYRGKARTKVQVDRIIGAVCNSSVSILKILAMKWCQES